MTFGVSGLTSWNGLGVNGGTSMRVDPLARGIPQRQEREDQRLFH